MKSISSKEIRANRMKYAYVMENIKKIGMLPVLNVSTIAMVADYLETGANVVSNYYAAHKKELEEYGIITLTVKDFENAGYKISSHVGYNKATMDNVEINVPHRGVRCMSENAVFNMSLGISYSEVAEKIKAAAALEETESGKHEQMNSEKVENTGNESEVAEDTTPEETAADILTFTNVEFGTIRLVEVDGQPWFVGKDVAEALGYSNTKDALKSHVDEEDKFIIQKSDFPTLEIPNRGMTAINESGMYSLIMSSKLPTAKQFKRWVTSEVLPSVRKNGGYIAGQEELTEAELMAKALLVAQKALEDRSKRINELTNANKAMAKEANTWDKKSVINALIRAYAGRCLGGDFKYAFSDFYRQFDYKYHTKLKARKDKSGNKNGSLLDFLTEEEMGNALKLAVAICEGRGINAGEIINEVNMSACV